MYKESGGRGALDGRRTSRVMMEDMCSIMRGILNIIWSVLPSCFVTPFTCAARVFSAPTDEDAGRRRAYLQSQLEAVRVGHGRLGDVRAATEPAASEQRADARWAMRAHLIGVKVSKPLAALHGWPFFLTTSCMFRAVMSTASAARVRRA